MKCSIRLAAWAAMLAASAFCASPAMGQDPVKVAPEMYKVRLDNSRVRVLEVTGKAGQKARLHVHPDYVVYSVGDGKTRFTEAKGATADAELKSGDVMWRPAETHASEAVTDIHAILFELKGPKRAVVSRPAGGADPVTADPAHFKVLLDNDRVRVLDFHARPGEKVAMHVHPDYITYDLNGSKTRFTYPKGQPAERESKPGDVTWHKAETHAGEITGGNDVHILLVELK
jgi:quercetin dioxygenase-like cupin family protein